MVRPPGQPGASRAAMPPAYFQSATAGQCLRDKAIGAGRRAGRSRGEPRRARLAPACPSYSHCKPRPFKSKGFSKKHVESFSSNPSYDVCIDVLTAQGPPIRRGPKGRSFDLNGQFFFSLVMTGFDNAVGSKVQAPVCPGNPGCSNGSDRTPREKKCQSSTQSQPVWRQPVASAMGGQWHWPWAAGTAATTGYAGATFTTSGESHHETVWAVDWQSGRRGGGLAWPGLRTGR